MKAVVKLVVNFDTMKKPSITLYAPRKKKVRYEKVDGTCWKCGMSQQKTSFNAGRNSNDRR